MKRIDQILTKIAVTHLNIPTLQPQRSDLLDFHNFAVWQVEAALKAAFEAGSCSARKNGHPEKRKTAAEYSPSPWSYDYSPYLCRQGQDGLDSELPAFEIFDANCDKIFDTNENTPCELQEANARLGAAAPRLLASLVTCANLLADFDESDGEEGKAYREGLAAITEATGRAA
jgi:hypothetical protein